MLYLSFLLPRQNESRTVDIRPSGSRFNACYAASFSDCQIEYTPTEGEYALCLIYHLRYMGQWTAPLPPRPDLLPRLLKVIEVWDNDTMGPKKLILPL